jgi:hypothetical protein
VMMLKLRRAFIGKILVSLWRESHPCFS